MNAGTSPASGWLVDGRGCPVCSDPGGGDEVGTGRTVPDAALARSATPLRLLATTTRHRTGDPPIRSITGGAGANAPAAPIVRPPASGVERPGNCSGVSVCLEQFDRLRRARPITRRLRGQPHARYTAYSAPHRACHRSRLTTGRRRHRQGPPTPDGRLLQPVTTTDQRSASATSTSSITLSDAEGRGERAPTRLVIAAACDRLTWLRRVRPVTAFEARQAGITLGMLRGAEPSGRQRAGGARLPRHPHYGPGNAVPRHRP